MYPIFPLTTRFPVESPEENSYYVDTPKGLVTAAGTHYHTREEALHRFARPVLNDVSIEQLLQLADRWLRSPQAATIWGLLLLLLVLPPGWAALGALALYVTWTLLSPAYVSAPVIRTVRWIVNPFVQGLGYVLLLSVLAARGQMVAVGVGLAGFILLRWRLIEKTLRPILKRLHARLYPLPPSDQVLRALIVRTAMQHGHSLPELKRLEKSFLKTLNP